MSRVLTEAQVVDQLRDGMTLGIGGWGSRRKPMSLVRAIARSNLRDLTVVSFGGPDVGVLCALGKVRKLVFGFVSLDSIPLEPHFRLARQQGRLPEVMELDEGMLVQGLRAAAWGLPFLPIKAGLGSDVLTVNPQLQLIHSPYRDGSGALIAMPALRLDAAIVHLDRCDPRGNGQYLGADPYFDDLFCQAADRAYVSCESHDTDTDQLPRFIVDPSMVDGVVLAPGGGWFTECLPDHPRDEDLQGRYAATAGDVDALLALMETL